MFSCEEGKSKIHTNRANCSAHQEGTLLIMFSMRKLPINSTTTTRRRRGKSSKSSSSRSRTILANAKANYSSLAHDGIAEAHESSLASMRLGSRTVSETKSSQQGERYAHEGIAEAHESSLASMRLAPLKGSSTTERTITTTTNKTLIKNNGTFEQQSAFELYFSATCPFCHKVWIAMLEKEIDTERSIKIVWEDLENKSDAFKNVFAKASPDAQANASVPVLVDKTGKTMIESALVLNYICCNETFPNKCDLRPKTAEQRYDGQMFENTFNTVVPAFFKCLRAKNEAELEGAIGEVELALSKADKCLQMTASFGGDHGNYCCGDQFTSHDCATMGFLSRLRIVLKHYRNYDLNSTLQKLPWLKSWADAVEQRPSLLKTYELLPAIVGKKSIEEAYVAHFSKFVSWSSTTTTSK